MTVGSALSDTTAALAAAGFDEPRRRARRLLAAALGLAPADILAHPERLLTATEAARVSDLCDRVAASEPLSRALGRREFWGLEFLLSSDTLDPRPETETVVEAVLARLPDRTAPHRFLDLGTGTGCLLLALLSEYRNATGVGIDLATGAAATARRNAAALGLHDRAWFAVGDWGASLAGGFDAVVANPPYIAASELPALPPEVREHDPPRALDGGLDGLAAYRALAPDLPRLLKPGGLFASEIGAGQGPAVAAIVIASGLAVEATLWDLAGMPRCLVVRRR